MVSEDPSTGICTVLGVKISRGYDYTSYWDILRRNFAVEHIDMIVGHYIEYRGSMSGMPILVLECSICPVEEECTTFQS